MRTMFIILCCALLGCNGCRDQRESSQADCRDIQEALIESNRRRHQQEDERIKAFCLEKQWPVSVTGTGLHYWIYEQGTGPKGTNGQVAVVAYTISLMDGKVCYTADRLHPARFVIGKDAVESGLHEVLLLMRTGDKAHLVMPSHLAFGFTGDSGCIPQESTVIYDLHVLDLE
ncbi:MAG: FKBP-type peptidyl-prolyl cis-trans isomerase [Flavobacteriales bacterium]